MDVKIMYSKPQLEAAVKFIAKYNRAFIGRKDYIRQSILDTMKEMALNPDQIYGGTMGYNITADKEFEGIENDENTAMFEISVDPALNIDIEPEDYIEEIIHGPGTD